MAKAIRFANDTYIDDSGIAINKNIILNNTIDYKLFAGNGYQMLPSGLLIQWGTDVSTDINVNEYNKTVNFPIKFPNSCFVVVCVLDDPGWGVTRLNCNIGVKDWTQTGWSLCFKRDNYYQAAQTFRARYIAIGY